ncbi:MAG: 4Fe-4S dicluster domain-containing protein [Syntrophobacterales bacterium]|jgi:heterodisulfide reductase subunit C|nr:4Fe-4S dicluster domain-containing protein [Syntrophobacterales bacterium]
MENATKESLKPRKALPALLTQANLNVESCFQCRKCSGGCALTFAMDLLPHHVIRLALLGQEERVFDCQTIWVCAGCQTCSTRCPNGIDIAGTMDWLKEEAVKRGRAIPGAEVAAFHRYFLEGIRDAGGRLPEAQLLRRFTMYRMRRQGSLAELKQNLALGWKLWKRGRVRLIGPSALRGKAEINNIYQKANF